MSHAALLFLLLAQAASQPAAQPQPPPSGPLPAVAQLPAPARQAPAGNVPQARFQSESNLVVLHVAVTDRDDGFVPDLTREDFVVYENGKPQPITFFEHAANPVTVGLLIDCSISMHRRRPAVVAAGGAFAESSHPDDEMFTINFNEHVWPGLPREQPFTSDREALRRALRASTARGKTALFDALRVALEQLGAGTRQKKVLIVISDGGDNASSARFDDVLAMALRMDALIYTVHIYDQYDREGNRDVLEQLAAATGGAAFFPRSASEARRVLERIAVEIRSGYTIGYVPSGDAEGFRKIRVNVRPGDDRRVSVRARSGYVAGSRP